MSIIRHEFTPKLINELNKLHSGMGDLILERSQLIQYLNIKTRSATRGSKSRSSFAKNILEKMNVRS